MHHQILQEINQWLNQPKIIELTRTITHASHSYNTFGREENALKFIERVNCFINIKKKLYEIVFIKQDMYVLYVCTYVCIKFDTLALQW